MLIIFTLKLVRKTCAKWCQWSCKTEKLLNFDLDSYFKANTVDDGYRR